MLKVEEEVERYIGWNNLPAIVYFSFAEKPFALINDCKVSNNLFEVLYPKKNIVVLDSPAPRDVKVFASMRINNPNFILLIQNPDRSVNLNSDVFLPAGWVVKTVDSDVNGDLPLIDSNNRVLRINNAPYYWGDLIDFVSRVLNKNNPQKNLAKAVKKTHSELKKVAIRVKKKLGKGVAIRPFESAIYRDHILASGGIPLSGGGLVSMSEFYEKAKPRLVAVMGGNFSSPREVINALVDEAINFVSGEIDEAPDHIVRAIANQLVIMHLKDADAELYHYFVLGEINVIKIS